MSNPQDPYSPAPTPPAATPPNPAPSSSAPSSSAPTPAAAPTPRRIPKSTPPPPPAPAKRSPPPPDHRRDFFNEAMRETLGPLAGLLESKINPLLAALESIPVEAERLANAQLPALLDQPQTREVPLPVVSQPLAEERFLYPPGADPGTFETLCSRCQKCVEACPANAILMDTYQYVAGGLPYILPRSQPCVVCTDLACMPACPTGALRMLERLQIKMGTARVHHDLCLRSHGENCTLCVDACPIAREGAHPEFGDALFIHADSGRVRVRFNACVGCGLCENRCPTNPAAIEVKPHRPPPDPIIA